MATRTTAVKKQSTALISFDDEVEALKAQLGAPSGDKIKVENKSFTLPSGATANELDVVIVDFVYFNTYYESAYQKGVRTPPACFALSSEEGALEPSANSPSSQCDTCPGCALNQWGSGVGDGKACQNRILIAVLPGDRNTTTKETPLAIIDLSPTAIKDFKNYVGSLARGMNRPPYAVVSHVTCDPKSKWDRVVFSDPQAFDMDDEDDAAFVQLIRSRRAEARERLLTEPDVKALLAANDAKPATKKSTLKPPVKRRAT